MFEIKNLKKSFGSNLIFGNVNFTVEDGDSVVIIGGSGCGKSTLLRCINRLEEPDSGQILFKGSNILDRSTDLDTYRRHVGMVYQSFNLFSHLNVMENMILAPMKVAGMSKAEAVDKAEHLLETVAMQSHRYKMPSQLSGGQKQRVAIARTLMMDPEAILFDEPTSALDPTMVDEVQSVIASLVASGMTSIIVTHEMHFAENIASKVIFLAENTLYDQGTPQEIFVNPAKELTWKFVNSSCYFQREVTGDSLDYLGLATDLRCFMIGFGLNKLGSAGIEHLIEEILMPLLGNGVYKSCVISVLCEKAGSHHKINLEFPDGDVDPLSCQYIDDIAVKLLRHYFSEISCEKNDKGNYKLTVVL